MRALKLFSCLPVRGIAFLSFPTPPVIAHLSHMPVLTDRLPLLGWLVDRKPQAVKGTIALLSLCVQERERGLKYLPGVCFSVSWDVL